MKMKSRLIAVVMSLALALTMMPITGAPVYAASKSNFYSGSDVLRDGSNTSEAATVHMAGTKWLVIGYGESQEGGITQVASSADTMTLIAANNLKTGVQFRADGQTAGAHNYGKNDNNEDSNLKNEIETLTDEDNGIFSAGERSGIVARDLAKGGYTGQEPYTNGIAGDEVKGARLWPLSTQEAYYMASVLRRASSYWWLRSRGYLLNFAAAVRDNGYVNHHGYDVDYSDGLRPAFNFNLSSVLFTSAAAGGKSSGTAGADSLEKIGEYMSGKEWKLTLKDDAHKEFKVEKVTKADEGKLKIEYSDAAVDGKKEYISAIVKTNAGGGEQFASWYGKLALAKKASGSNDPSCELTIPKNLEAGDEIYVFNEQCNQNASTTTPAETDYASEPKKVYTAPNPKITEQPAEELKLAYGDTTGNVLSVKAEAASGNTLSYQWYYKDSPTLVSGTKIDNATGASYTVPTDQNVEKTLYYYCVVTEKDQYGGEISSKSNLAAVTVNKAKLTIKPKDQTFTYNGQKQGPGDVIYFGQQVEQYVDVSGLKFSDYLRNVNVGGQGEDVGEYELDSSSGYVAGSSGTKQNDNYDIKYETGKLTIGKAPITIKADYKNCKDLDNAAPFTWTMEDEENNWYETERADIALTVTDDKGTVIDPKTAAAGKYKIVPSWKTENKNYDATFVNGTFEKHKMTPHEEVPPTCTAPGKEAYWTCGLCSKMFSDKDGSSVITEPVEITPLGHDYSVELPETAKAPTCTEDGKEADMKCSRCEDKQEGKKIDKTGHLWGQWEVAKKPTALNKGEEKRVCKHDSSHVETKAIAATGVSGTPLSKMKAKGKTALTISWSKIKGAEGYDIFFAKCGNTSKYKKEKTIKGNKTFSWTKTGLKKKKPYKAYVKAWAMKDGKKKYVSKSPSVHTYTSSSTKNYTLAKAVKVNKTKVSLKKGKTFKIKASIVKQNRKKKLMPTDHAPKLRYVTSNSKIATVTKSGKMTAKGSGTCYIYVYAHNGVSKQIKVVVNLN